MCRGDLGWGQPADPPSAVHAKALPPRIEPDAPWISWPHVTFEKGYEFQSVRPQLEITGVEQTTCSPRCFHARFTAITVAKIKLPIWAPNKGVDGLMGVSIAKTTQQNLALIGPAIAIGILEEE